MKFNEKLIELRKKEGLSQEELGYKLNVTRQTVSKWELGQTTPEMDKLIEMGKIFNVSVDELINESEVTANQNPVFEDQPIGNEGSKNNKIRIILIGLLIAIIVYVVAQVLVPFGAFNMFNQGVDDEAKGFIERIFGLFDRILDMEEEQLEKADNVIDGIQYQINSNDPISGMGSQLNEIAFNALLQIYSGSNNGLSLKQLLDQVITINKTKDQKITIKYNELETQDTEQIKNLKTNIKESNNFEVSFDYDEEGYVNKVTIEKVVSEFEIKSFNNSFEIYSGSNPGVGVESILDKIITSNKTEDRKITVKYKETETQDESEIKNIKQKIGTFDDYEITYEYDADGFINKTIIEKL